MQKILERLLVCDLSEANDPFFLKLHDVQAILYFGDGGLFGDDIKLYHRPKSGTGLSEEEIADGVDFLRESLRSGRRVLAVGPTGATIAAAYLMEMGFSNRQALEAVSSDSVPRPDRATIESHAEELTRRAKTTLGHE